MVTWLDGYTETDSEKGGGVLGGLWLPEHKLLVVSEVTKIPGFIGSGSRADDSIARGII